MTTAKQIINSTDDFGRFDTRGAQASKGPRGIRRDELILDPIDPELHPNKVTFSVVFRGEIHTVILEAGRLERVGKVEEFRAAVLERLRVKAEEGEAKSAEDTSGRTVFRGGAGFVKFHVEDLLAEKLGERKKTSKTKKTTERESQLDFEPTFEGYQLWAQSLGLSDTIKDETFFNSPDEFKSSPAARFAHIVRFGFQSPMKV